MNIQRVEIQGQDRRYIYSSKANIERLRFMCSALDFSMQKRMTELGLLFHIKVFIE